MPKKIGVSLAAILLTLCLNFPAVGQGPAIETVDVVGQTSDGPVVSTDGAMLIRLKNRITISLTMPTPAPGSYTYPPVERTLVHTAGSARKI